MHFIPKQYRKGAEDAFPRVTPAGGRPQNCRAKYPSIQQAVSPGIRFRTFIDWAGGVLPGRGEILLETLVFNPEPNQLHKMRDRLVLLTQLNCRSIASIRMQFEFSPGIVVTAKLI